MESQCYRDGSALEQGAGELILILSVQRRLDRFIPPGLFPPGLFSSGRLIGGVSEPLRNPEAPRVSGLCGCGSRHA